MYLTQKSLLRMPTRSIYLQKTVFSRDSMTGIDAAHANGMKAVGIGTQKNLPLFFQTMSDKCFCFVTGFFCPEFSAAMHTALNQIEVCVLPTFL